MSLPQIHRVDSDVFDPLGGDGGTVYGKNLTGTTDVRVGVTAATNVTVVSDTQVTFTAPAKAAGKYPVAVKNATGWTSMATAVEYANPGTLSGCVWHMDPATANIDVDGLGGVTKWRDTSGVGDINRNATPPTADNPAWNGTDAGYGNKPTVGSFNRVGAFRLKTGAWSATYNTFSLVAIGHTAAAGNRYFTYESDTEFNSLLNAGGTPTVYANDSLSAISGAGDLSKPRSLMAAVFNGATSLLHVESTSYTGNLAGAVLGGAGVSIGSYSVTSNQFGVERVARIAAYNRALSLREMRTIRRWRDSYYGAP